jgi:predicted MFS family arabinose efflux permease
MMTIRQAARRKVTRALLLAAAFLIALLLVYAFERNAPWAGISVVFMFGFMASMFYIVWFVDCPKCHAAFGQRNVFNIALNFNSKFCPNCKTDLDTPLQAP